MPNLGLNQRFFVLSDLEIWQMTLKNNRAPFLYNFKLFASFHSHLSIQNGVTIRKCQLWVKIGDFLSRVTLKFDGWPWKTIGHLFDATSSFVHIFIAISQFKMELQSGNAKFGSKSAIFLSRVTLKFDGWLWKTIGHLFYATPSFVHHFIAICQFKMELQSGNSQFGWKSAIFFVPCDLDIWRMTLKNNRAPPLCYFKLCASFHNHPWIQTGVTVRKRLSWVLTSVTLTVDLWPWPFAWISRLSLVITPENFMTIRLREHSEKGVTDGRTNGRTDG